MLFRDVISRLSAEVRTRTRGVPVDYVTVRRADLRDLLNDWERLDRERRNGL